MKSRSDVYSIKHFTALGSMKMNNIFIDPRVTVYLEIEASIIWTSSPHRDKQYADMRMI